jgi:hypothetical protein
MRDTGPETPTKKAPHPRTDPIAYHHINFVQNHAYLSHYILYLKCRINTARPGVEWLHLACRYRLTNVFGRLRLELRQPALHRSETRHLDGLHRRVSGALTGEEVGAVVAVAQTDGVVRRVRVSDRVRRDCCLLPRII